MISEVTTDQRMLLVDLDTTLFRSREFWKDFAATVMALSNVESQLGGSLVDQQPDYTVGDGRAVHTDYARILEEYELTHDAVAGAVRVRCSGSNYLFPDAYVWLRDVQHRFHPWTVLLLTCGDDRYQSMKTSTFRHLASVPTLFTKTTKAEFIARHLPRSNGVLVDDKPGQDLPSGWSEIRIDRFGTRPPSTEDLVISDLSNLTPQTLSALLP